MAKIKSRDYFPGLFNEMIKNDKPRNDVLNEIDKMVEMDWSLPEAMTKVKSMRAIISTDPASVIIVGRRTLATLKPQVFIQPLNTAKMTKKLANMNEKNLLWQLQRADARSRRSITGDIVESALRHDAVATFTVPVNWQLKGTGRSISDESGFMVMVENYKYIHPRFSPLGLESVLHVKIMRAKEAVQFWGNIGECSKLKKDIQDKEEEFYIVAYEWWGEDKRFTGLSDVMKELHMPETANIKYQIHDDDPELPFNPWTIKEGGTSLGRNEQHKLRPLLSPLVHAKVFDNQNVAGSIAYSEVIAHSAAPRGKVVSHDPESVVINYNDFQNRIDLGPGEDYIPLDPPVIDRSLLDIIALESGKIDRLTGIKNLGTLDPPSGTAFATVNVVIKAATAALDPAKILAESALAGIFENMIRWTAHTGDTMVGYGTGDEDMGREYTLGKETIDPNNIYIDAKLSTHIPTDRQQRINSASILIREMDYSKEDAYRELDIANPEEIIERRRQEILDESMLANTIKEMNAETDLRIQEQQMAMQMQFQQVQQQQEMQAQEQAQRQQARMLAGEPQQSRVEQPRKMTQSLAARGPGFDPSRGGISPNEAVPEGLLRENVLGIDKRGESISE